MVVKIVSRSVLIFSLVFGYVSNTLSQRRVAMVREPNNKIHVYKSPGHKSGTVAMIDNKTFFYIDSSSGNYYSFDMSHVEEGLVEGYVKKSDVKDFIGLPIAEQKKLMSEVFNKYISLSLSRTSGKPVAYPSFYKRDKTDSITAPALYYISTLSPFLGEFIDYYNKSQDVETLKKLFSLGSFADGEFGQSLSMVFYKIYMKDKDKFAALMKTVSDPDIASITKERLVYGIQTFLPPMLVGQGFSPEESLGKVQEEIELVKKF